MSTTIRLFDATNIEQLPWPDTFDGIYARNYLLPMVLHGTTHYIENVQTKVMVLLLDEKIILPITVNKREYQNSYVCSPYGHYVPYAKEELVLIEQRWLKRALALLIDAFGVLCKLSRINQCVHINNWLLSTNLYPELQEEQIREIIVYLKSRFPKHTLIFRSLNAYSHASQLAALKKIGARLIPSRQVYLVKPADPTFVKAKACGHLRQDFSLIARGGDTIVEGQDLGEDDIPRIVELYNLLYIKKYSSYNPMFNKHFVRLALEKRILELVVLKKDGRIDAVLGYFYRNGIMTTPLFGYDTGLPQNIGLYRMLSVILYYIARDKEILLHESFGAAKFKRYRGAIDEIEYSGIYDRHVPWWRRLCWSFLSLCLEKVGVPLMKKYKL